MPTSRTQRLDDIRRQLRVSIAAIFGVVAIGILGYSLLEGWSLFDSAYMTIITLAGVGYGETHPLDGIGRLFTIFLIVAGVFSFGNIVSQVARAISEGYFQEVIQIRRRTTMLTALQEHYIVCGLGRIGGQVCRDFATDNVAFVVIEQDEALCKQASAIGYLVLQGDASSDQLLQEAGIARAKCIVCALPSDAENLYIVLSAKLLNPKIFTIARASNEESVAKLTRVGADRVVSPYLTGAKRMAALALRPQVVDFTEAALVGKNNTFYIEELLLDTKLNCPFLNRSLKEVDIRAQSGALVLAIRRADGELFGSPTGDTRLEEGDLLICMGTAEQLRALSNLLIPSKIEK